MHFPFTILDLFCGAGGFSLGFKNAGFDLVCAYDNDSAALRTHKENIGAHAFKSDLSKETDLPSTTVIIGGPPCQGFSSAGLRRAGDKRNSLVSCFANTITRLKPSAFVFENVEGFLTAENGHRVMDLLTPLIACGYRIHLRKINAANYGVPQHRKRVIAIGGLGWNPSFPNPTHTAHGAPGAKLASKHLPLTPTITEALKGLPPPTVVPPGIPHGHYYSPLKGIDLERAAGLRPGQTMRDLPEELQHNSYRRRAYRRVMDGTPSERRGGPPAGLRRLHPDEPSKAITGGARSEFIHPLENRNLTIRECAKIQTFPDDYTFFGNPSEQSQLIGNAVPPLLAHAIASTLASDLAHLAPMSIEGALLSFIPTLSEGFSPVLCRVTELVHLSFSKSRNFEELPLWQ